MSPSLPATDVAAQRRQRGRWLDARLAPFRGRHRAASACVVLAGWLWIPQAAAIAWALDAVLFAHAGLAALPAPLGLLAATLIARPLLTWIGQRLQADVVESVLAQLRVGLARAAADRGPLWLRGQRSGALVALSTGHVDATAGYYGGYLTARAETMAVPLAILVAVFAVDWIVGLVLLLTAPLAPFFMMLIGMGAENAGRRQLAALARAGAHFTDRLRGLDLIRVYGRGEAELAQVGEATETIRVRSMRVLRIAFLSSAVLEFFASVSVALVAVYFGFTYLGMLDLRGETLSLSTGLFCLLLAPEFYAPMRRLAANYHDRANALAAVAEIEATFDGLPEIEAEPLASRRMDADLAEGQAVPRPSASPAPEPPGDQGAKAHSPARPLVSVANVVLRHPGARAPALQDVSLQVPAGGRLALVGPSGSGKSTLLDALAGWLPAETGRIDVAPGTRIALASQRPWLFHGSIADNLRIGAPDASDVELAEAARVAQVTRFAARLPDGLDTPIGERGFGLSGGEARRVALARALLRRPRLLLLDEPTAFLDPGTEADLLAALDAYLDECTVIVATHSDAVVAWAGASWQVPSPTGAAP
ncbi:thiol reductant ABC exporter subunit CydD [Luteimonas chenhongjianii]|uniref:Thiol reductant ABC exporter subunit CydD n=1 Tax=Luteimonas chenhongjianii TaxID=2006110 RepID=A0A290XI71_9GAMM|nr:thiol reductant ABC exporter subunit CydD [Luteimonas chenhongjianii]ATD68773.1 thiol reductant ABC exporter subunit CydD [Luteimonas chenhongjianii]